MDSNYPFSVIIFSKNSEQFLADGINSVKFADEVIVFDMESSDGSAALAKKMGVKVISFKDHGYVEAVRQQGISKAKHEWVLVLDGDESISDGLKQWLQSFASRDSKPTDIKGYYLPRKNIIFGQEMRGTGWWPDYQMRFFHQQFLSWPTQIHQPPVVKGEVEYLKADAERCLIHHNYQSVSQYLHRLNNYSDIMAEQRGKIKQASLEDVFSSWKQEVFRRWFVNQAEVDGGRGLALGLLQGTSELATFLKQWEMAGFPETDQDQSFDQVIRLFQSDLNYWLADYHVKNSSGIGKIWWMIRRKLRI